MAEFVLACAAFVDDEELVVRSLRRERVFRDRENAFELHDIAFKELYRVSKDIMMNLIDSLREHLPQQTRRSAISIEQRVLAAVRFLAVGSYQRGIGQEVTVALSQKSISRCLRTVCQAVSQVLLRQWVRFPQNQVDILQTKQGFMRKLKFPGVIGAIDGTHIAIVAPQTDENHREGAFVCRKNYHSINTQVVCDSNMIIMNVNSLFPGSTHDSFIWKYCDLRGPIEQAHNRGLINGWLLGDSGYPLQPWLMTPITQNQTPAETHYNRRHVKARNIVERCIGVLKSRWRCILKERVLHYSPEVASIIINTCVVLHNMCIHEGLPDADPADVEIQMALERGEGDDEPLPEDQHHRNPILIDGRRTQLKLLRQF